jgi:hypothetical protein
MADEPVIEPTAPDDEGTPEGEPKETVVPPAPTAAGGGGVGNDVPELDLEENKAPKFEEAPPKEVDRPIEKVRAQVARALVALLAVVIFFSFLTLWMVSPPPGLADLEKVLTIIFGPLIALVSGAVGYYFGGKSGGGG